MTEEESFLKCLCKSIIESFICNFSGKWPCSNKSSQITEYQNPPRVLFVLLRQDGGRLTWNAKGGWNASFRRRKCISPTSDCIKKVRNGFLFPAFTPGIAALLPFVWIPKAEIRVRRKLILVRKPLPVLTGRHWRHRRRWSPLATHVAPRRLSTTSKGWDESSKGWAVPNIRTRFAYSNLCYRSKRRRIIGRPSRR